MNTLYDFLKSKLKEKNVSMDTLNKKCYTSRTTMYRIMKGIVKPSDEVCSNIEKALNFSETEKHTFRYFLNNADSATDFSETLNTLLRILIFNKPNLNMSHSDNEFICYHPNEKNIRSYQQILNDIYSEANSEAFSCEIHIVNCSSEAYLLPLINLLSSVDKKRIAVEHLIRLHEKDNETALNMLCTVMPLLAYGSYNPFFKESGSTSLEQQFFSDLMIIKYTYGDSHKTHTKFIVLSFDADNFSDCLRFENETTYSFFLKNYSKLKKEYQDSMLVAKRNFSIYEDFYCQMEADNDLFLLKPNPCYSKIPLSVYNSMRGRYTPDDMANFISYVNLPAGTQASYEQLVDVMYESIKKRIEYSYKNKNIDVCTRNGMIEFAKTGRLSDHFSFLPSLTKEEIKETLLCIKARYNDKNDKFTMCIVNDEMLSECVWMANSSGGILCEILYDDAHSNNRDIFNFYIQNRELSKIFIDFVSNYVPKNLAISFEETNEFLDFLIEEYC